MITPVDIGLPPKFRTFRKEVRQWETIQKLFRSDSRFLMLQAPPGCGKTLIGNGLGLLGEYRYLYLTKTKSLQAQNYSEMASIGMVDIVGHSNYPCSSVSYDDQGELADMECRGRRERGIDGCAYRLVVDRCIKTEKVSSNYSHWIQLYKSNDPDRLGKFSLLVLDEAHTIHSTLAESASIKLFYSQIERLLEISRTPGEKGSIEEWVEWSMEAAVKGSQLLAQRSYSSRDRFYLERLVGSLKRVYIEHDYAEWVLISLPSGKGIQLKPLNVARYAEPYLFRGVEKILLMSATLFKDDGETLGIDPSSSCFISIQSAFPAKRRPIIYFPTTPSIKVDKSLTARGRRLWIEQIDRTLEFEGENSKGIIQSRCVEPKTLIITSDLKWVRADSIKVGDSLLAFDEFPSRGCGGSRKWRLSEVLDVARIYTPCIRVNLEDGSSIVCSRDHLWLTHNSVCPRWVKTCNLMTGSGAASHLMKVLDVWSSLEDWEHGYLAGAYDGEGCIYQRHRIGRKKQSFATLSFTQKNGLMLDLVEKLLKKNGFRFTKPKNRTRNIERLLITGASQYLRFFGEFRPVRLLDNISLNDLGKFSLLRRVRVISREEVGLQEVMFIKTSTGTFIADGFASHNSYDRADDILSMSSKRSQIFTHTSLNSREVIDSYRKSSPPRTIISPILEEGEDFPFDLCDYVILSKLPFLDMRQPYIKALASKDKDYPNRELCRSIIQMSLRGMRSSDDWCRIWIYCAHWRWVNRLPWFYGWFRAAFVSIDRLEQAPRRPE